MRSLLPLGCKIESTVALIIVTAAEASSTNEPSEILNMLCTDSCRFNHSHILSLVLSLEMILSFAKRITEIMKAKMKICYHCLSSWSSRSGTVN